MCIACLILSRGVSKGGGLQNEKLMNLIFDINMYIVFTYFTCNFKKFHLGTKRIKKKKKKFDEASKTAKGQAPKVWTGEK